MFAHAVVLGPSVAAPWRADDVGNATRLVAALRRTGARTALVTSVDAAAPIGPTAPDRLVMGPYDAPTLLALLTELAPDALFWLPGGLAALEVVSAVEQTGYFQEAGIAIVPRPERVRRVQDPDLLAQLVRGLELGVPPHHVVADGIQLRGAAKTLGLPLSVRPLAQLPCVPWTTIRDDGDLRSLSDLAPASRHWVVRRAPRSGLVADVVVAGSMSGETRALGLAYHGEAWLADCAQSTLVVTDEVSTEITASLTETACRVAQLMGLPGVTTIRLHHEAETTELLEVMPSPGPAWWLQELRHPQSLQDLHVRLVAGGDLPIDTGAELDRCLPAIVAVPRLNQLACLDSVVSAYMWGAGATGQEALAAVLDHQVCSAGPVSPGRTNPLAESVRTGGAERWSAARRERQNGAGVEELVALLGAPRQVVEALLGPASPTARREPLWSRPTGPRLATPSAVALLTVPPLATDVCLDEQWAAVQAAEALRRHSRESAVLTCNLPLAGLLRELGHHVLAPGLARDAFVDALEQTGIAAIYPFGSPLLPDITQQLRSRGIRVTPPDEPAVSAIDPTRRTDDGELGRIPCASTARVTSLAEALAQADLLGWPVFVSSGPVGAWESTASSRAELAHHCHQAGICSERPLVLTHIPPVARLLDAEALCVRGRIVLSAWTEHVHGLGSASRLTFAICPPQRTYPELLRRGRALLGQLAELARHDGALAARFIVTPHDIVLLSSAPGSPRSWSRLSRALDLDWAEQWMALATDAAGNDRPARPDGDHIAVSLRRVSATSGSVMRALTPAPGSLTLLGEDADDLVLQALAAGGLRLPVRSAWLSASSVEDRIHLIRPARLLRQAGIRLHATEATAACLRVNDVEVSTLAADDARGAVPAPRRRVDLVVVPSSRATRGEDEARLIRFAEAFHIPLIEDVGVLERVGDALVRRPLGTTAVRSWSGEKRPVQKWA